MLAKKYCASVRDFQHTPTAGIPKTTTGAVKSSGMLFGVQLERKYLAQVRADKVIAQWNRWMAILDPYGDTYSEEQFTEMHWLESLSGLSPGDFSTLASPKSGRERNKTDIPEVPRTQPFPGLRSLNTDAVNDAANDLGYFLMPPAHPQFTAATNEFFDKGKYILNELPPPPLAEWLTRRDHRRWNETSVRNLFIATFTCGRWALRSGNTHYVFQWLIEQQIWSCQDFGFGFGVEEGGKLGLRMGINPQSEDMFGNRCWDKSPKGPFWDDTVAEVGKAFGAWLETEIKAETKRRQDAEQERRKRYEQLRADREEAWRAEAARRAQPKETARQAREAGASFRQPQQQRKTPEQIAAENKAKSDEQMSEWETQGYKKQKYAFGQRVF